MAKLKGPLFSLFARGPVGKVLSYRSTPNGSTAARAGAPTGAPSAAQINHRVTMTNAAIAWRSASTELRDQWNSYGAATSRTGYLEFSREYMIQRITPPDLPRLPAAPW